MSSRPVVIIGTRGSDLALWQSQWVKQKLFEFRPSLNVDISIIKTTGDKILDSPLSKIGDKGLFTKEIDASLLDHSVDLAVHSLKDVPTVLPEGLTISAYCKREDVRDVFISHPEAKHSKLSEVPLHGTIATGSLRRRCLLLRLRPDLTIVDVRGNLGTRIDKLTHSSWDGMILAKAGVERLGRPELIAEVLPPTQFLPAVGQGALAVIHRQDDELLTPLVHSLDHLPTRQATLGERALLRRLEGGCQIPIGAYGRIEKGLLRLEALVGSIDGKRTVHSSIEGSPEDSEHLGVVLAEKLLKKGGDVILDEIRRFIA